MVQNVFAKEQSANDGRNNERELDELPLRLQRVFGEQEWNDIAQNGYVALHFRMGQRVLSENKEIAEYHKIGNKQTRIRVLEKISEQTEQKVAQWETYKVANKIYLKSFLMCTE